MRIIISQRSSKEQIHLHIWGFACSVLIAAFGVTSAHAQVLPPALTVSKSVDRQSAVDGDALMYAVVVVNNVGAGTAAQVIVSDQLPASVTFVSATHSGTFANGTVTWPAVSLLPGASLTRTLIVTVGAGGGSIPQLSFSATPAALPVGGGAVTLSWSGQQVTGCTASNGWSGVKPVQGSETITVTANRTFTLTCTGSNGSVSQTVTVTVDSGGGGGGNTVLYDGFEGPQSTVDAFIDGTASSLSAEEAFAGARSLKMCADQGNACKFSYRYVLPGGGYEDLYARYIFKIGNPQAWYDANGNPRTGEHYKNPGLEGGSSNCKAGYHGYDCVAVRTRMLTPHYGIHIEGGVFDGSFVDEAVNVIDGKWHCIEQHLKLNTLGQTNGILEYWVDGNKHVVGNNLVYRHPDDPWKLTKWWWTYWSNDNWLGPTYVDELIISRQPIGCPIIP